MSLLIPPKAPALPLARDTYDRRAEDEINRILRLYFNQLDNTFGGVLGVDGVKYLRAPHGAFQRDTDFNFATANTASIVTVPTTDFASGVYYEPGDGIHVEQSGVYNLQYSVQFANTDSQAHNAWLWLRKNGSDLAGTNSKFSVPSTHGSSDGYLLAACNFYVSLAAGDWVELWSAASQVENGVTDGVYIEAYTAQVSPFAAPAIPSVVLTLSFVSAEP